MEEICVVGSLTGLSGLFLLLIAVPFLYRIRAHPFVKSRGISLLIFFWIGICTIISWLTVDMWYCSDQVPIILLVWLRLAAPWMFLIPLLLRVIRSFTQWAYVSQFPIGIHSESSSSSLSSLNEKEKDKRGESGAERTSVRCCGIPRRMIKHRVFLGDKTASFIYLGAVLILTTICTMVTLFVITDEEKQKNYVESTKSVPILVIPFVIFGIFCMSIIAMMWKVKGDVYFIRTEFVVISVTYFPITAVSLPLAFADGLVNYSVFVRLCYLVFLGLFSFYGLILGSRRWDAKKYPSYTSTTASADEYEDIDLESNTKKKEEKSSSLREEKPDGGIFWKAMLENDRRAQVFKTFLSKYRPGEDHSVPLITVSFLSQTYAFQKNDIDVWKFGIMSKINTFHLEDDAYMYLPGWMFEEETRALAIEEIGRLRKLEDDDTSAFGMDSKLIDSHLFDGMIEEASDYMNRKFGDNFIKNYNRLAAELGYSGKRIMKK